MPSWRVAQIHNVDIFERVGFPVRITSIRDVGQIVDTMQENRFRSYIDELSGLSEDEYGVVARACKDAVDFQLSYLPRRTPVVPLSTLLSAFALYTKMLGANPSFRSVLEIGPGCGYLSFFLRRHPQLQNYSQVEACESFYILQNLVNLFCFGIEFDEHAFLPSSVSALDYFMNPRSDTEVSPKVNVESKGTKCSHYPWWRIGEIINSRATFDIVTSNANLMEFNRAALDDYLSILHRALAPSGVFLVQCTGHSASGTVDELFEKLYEKQFAPLLIAEENKPIGFAQQQKANFLEGWSSESRGQVQFTTKNAIFVKNGHPLFDRHYDKQNYRFGFIAAETLVRRTFFDRPKKRRDYSARDFVNTVEGYYSNSGKAGQ